MRRTNPARAVAAGAMAALALLLTADLLSGYRLLPSRSATGAAITQAVPD